MTGLSSTQTIQRLVRYSVRTSMGIDLTRGVCTLLGVIIIGLPTIRALRTAWGSPDRRTDEAPATRSTPISSEALERREQARTRTKAWFTDQEDTA